MDPKKETNILTALRTAQQHQVRLNSNDDQKANIMIGFTVVFFSIAQTQIFNPQGHEAIYFVPLLILSVMVAISFIMAILVVVPRVKKHEFTKLDDVPNPLFFGYYTEFSQEEYLKFMNAKLEDDKGSRELMIKDLYQIGQVLKKRYRYLALSYRFLVLGISISLILLVISYLLK